MPGKKKKYSVRFPPGRIKKIMQKDTEVGRIAMAVPVIISRALEMFLRSLLTKTCLITQAKFSSVVSLAHIRCNSNQKQSDLADGTSSTATQKDNRGMSMWPVYRNRNMCVKKASGATEVVPQRSHGPPENDSSSSETELYICL